MIFTDAVKRNIETETEVGAPRQNFLDVGDHLFGERTICRHADISKPAVLVVKLDDLRQIRPQERLAAGRQQKQKFPHTARHSVDFVQLEFERFSSWTFLIEEIEAMTAAQIANLSDEVNEVDGHGILLEEDLLTVVQEIQTLF